ncbi:hypothetical protein [Spirillospora albida]|uniref:hypothetical protein n=1 Tax=Spirillospora albida TaxID=58123 RepID=UPI0004BF8A8C|nr:hypothetical protein [Spirillospora albida]
MDGGLPPDDHAEGTRSRAGVCTWGGEATCGAAVEFSVRDRAGARWAACPGHLVDYVRDRLKHGA